MADLSLHYTSKAPLAGTYTAFNHILANWRRRARERRELASLDSRTIRDLGLSTSEVQFEAASPSGGANSPLRSEPVPTLRELIFLRILAGGRSSASLSTAGFFFAREHALVNQFI